jgi:hypothetical protein
MALNELGFLWSLKKAKTDPFLVESPEARGFERNPMSGVEFELRAVTRERHSRGPHPASQSRFRSTVRKALLPVRAYG